MIEIKSQLTADSFFAARNSHNGFESYFDRLFNPRDYTKLFILKGGPGTGKSTLMRGIISFANQKEIPAYSVLCSSDPNSLDGVILDNGNKRIAIIDGTAPHTRDPIFPGAIDEIINLGDGFNTSILEGKREEIVTLSKEKSTGYKKAYSTLGTAKDIFDYIWNSFLESKIYSEAEFTASSLLSELDPVSRTGKNMQVLYSAFGKNGYTALPTINGQKTVSLKGDKLVCSLVMRCISERLSNQGISAGVIRSSLDDRLIDRIIFNNFTLISGEEGEVIDIGEYNPCDYCENYHNMFASYTALLNLAANRFKEASDAHFALEAIYSGAIDFRNNESVFQRLCERLDKIFA